MIPGNPPASTETSIERIARAVRALFEGGVGGPATGGATDNRVARWDGTDGRNIQNSLMSIDDTGNVSGIALVGTTTNDNAAAGNVGQYIESVIPSGSAVALTTSTYANLTSISLTAGDWDVTAVFEFTGNAATTVNYFFGGITLTSATVDLTNGRVTGTAFAGSPAIFGIAAPLGTHVPVRRFSLASTTTVYAVAVCSFGVSTASVYGILSARRVR